MVENGIVHTIYVIYGATAACWELSREPIFSYFSATLLFPSSSKSSHTKCTNQWFTAEVILPTHTHTHTHTQTDTHTHTEALLDPSKMCYEKARNKRTNWGDKWTGTIVWSGKWTNVAALGDVNIWERNWKDVEVWREKMEKLLLSRWSYCSLTMVHCSEKRMMRGSKRRRRYNPPSHWWCDELLIVPGQSPSDED